MYEFLYEKIKSNLIYMFSAILMTLTSILIILSPIIILYILFKFGSWLNSYKHGLLIGFIVFIAAVLIASLMEEYNRFKLDKKYLPIKDISIEWEQNRYILNKLNSIIVAFDSEIYHLENIIYDKNNYSSNKMRCEREIERIIKKRIKIMELKYKIDYNILTNDDLDELNDVLMKN